MSLPAKALSEPKREGVKPLRVSFYVFFPAGGIGRYTNELLLEMSRLPGLEVEAICTPDFQWRDASGYASWAGLESISHPIPLLRRLRFLRGQIVNPVRGIEHAVRTGADLIHFSNINHVTFSYWRKHLEKAAIPVAVSVHDVRRQKPILNRAWEERQLKAFYRYADALFVHSAYQADELVAYAGVDRARIHVVPHGPYPHAVVTRSREEIRRQLGLPQDRQVVLFFGQLRDEKNLDGFLEAMRMSKSRPHLVVAGQAGGRHRDVAYYQALVERLGLSADVTFLARYIPDEEVGELFTAADWAALPYRNAFTSQSGVLNVAAHYRTPVLVSSSPVIKETVEACDIGVVCSGDTAEALAEGIERMAERLRTGHRHLFDEYLDRFSWRENARRTFEAYQSILHLPTASAGEALAEKADQEPLISAPAGAK